MKIERRNFWQVLMVSGLAVAALPAEGSNDKRTLLALFDKVGIDVADPSVDKTPYSISISVNGDNVTGTEGGLVIFKFNPKGALIEVVVWNDKVSNTDSPQ
jgi:hypothetical protein